MSETQISKECTQETRTRRLVVEDAEGRDRVVVGDNDRGFPSMTFLDRQGVARLVMEMSEDGTPLFTMRDPKGVTRVTLFCVPGTPHRQI